MEKPSLSVIVPIHGIEPYLPKCIDSILIQSYTDFELILVDNGSPDNCPQICDEYQQKDGRIKVIHKPNEGLLSARKAGLKFAKGKFIAYIDGDDWVDIFYLETLYKLAQANDADLVIGGHYREFDGKIESISPAIKGIFDEVEIKHHIIPNAIFNGHFFDHTISTYVWGKLFKREFLIKYLFDIPKEIVMGEDACITYPYLTFCDKIVITDIPIYYYRQRSNSIVKSIDSQVYEYRRLKLVYNFLKEKLNQHISSDKLYNQLKNYLYSLMLIRSGGLIELGHGKIFNPFTPCFNNSKIIVYSSGSFGQHLLTANKNLKFFDIIGWLDIDFHTIKIDGKKVAPISSVMNMEFDYLIIATVNPIIYKNISSVLQQFGVNRNKICQIKHDNNTIEYLFSTLKFHL